MHWKYFAKLTIWLLWTVVKIEFSGKTYIYHVAILQFPYMFCATGGCGSMACLYRFSLPTEEFIPLEKSLDQVDLYRYWLVLGKWWKFNCSGLSCMMYIHMMYIHAFKCASFFPNRGSASNYWIIDFYKKKKLNLVTKVVISGGLHKNVNKRVKI